MGDRLTPETAAAKVADKFKLEPLPRGKYLIYLKGDATDPDHSWIKWKDSSGWKDKSAHHIQCDGTKDRLHVTASHPNEHGGIFVALTIGSKPLTRRIGRKPVKRGSRKCAQQPRTKQSPNTQGTISHV